MDLIDTMDTNGQWLMDLIDTMDTMDYRPMDKGLRSRSRSRSRKWTLPGMINWTQDIHSHVTTVVHVERIRIASRHLHPTDSH